MKYLAYYAIQVDLVEAFKPTTGRMLKTQSALSSRPEEKSKVGDDRE
jgi:hypothetical protein